jgi:ADP-ribosyl-[dinitrogen reductase] hydrolase
MKTSLNDPLRIAQVSPPDVGGVIGLTLCPGKKDEDDGWDRDLDIDVAAIRDWGAEVVVSLIESWEFELLEVTELPSIVKRHGMRWVHLPIRDVSVPRRSF